jgi:hypothetical protein
MRTIRLSISAACIAAAFVYAGTAYAECDARPAKCPDGYQLFYSASTKSCPTGSYSCRPLPAQAKPAATTTLAKPAPQSFVKSSQAAKPAVKKPAAPPKEKPRTALTASQNAEAKRQLDVAKAKLERLLAETVAPQTRPADAVAAPAPSVQKTEAIAPKMGCTFNGTGLGHGRFVFAYEAMSVAHGATCRHQIRTCDNGTLSGSYEHAACSVGSAASCTFNGVPIEDGGFVTAFQAARGSAGSPCISEIRMCSNGALSGSFGFTACADDQSQQAGGSVLNFTPPQGTTPQGSPSGTQGAQQANEAAERARLEAAQRAAEQARQANVNAANNAVQNAVRNAVNAAIPRIR